ncbi:hypothetical protein SAMN05518872_104190 [Psychrobacillus sp. OK032]|nr:hypothetical protein SAMN05518872_104190 [Psychrobacillus sp. OK032]
MLEEYSLSSRHRGASAKSFAQGQGAGAGLTMSRKA